MKLATKFYLAPEMKNEWSYISAPSCLHGVEKDIFGSQLLPGKSRYFVHL